MRDTGIDVVNRLGAAKVADIFGRFEWGALSPGTLPDGAPVLLALVPPVAAGLLLFHLFALKILGIAVLAALIGHVAARLLKWRLELTLLVPALIAVAFVGAGANLLWVGGIAAGACALEMLRSRFLPIARVSTGLLAYAAVFVASLGAVAAYLRPANLQTSLDPITLWHRFPAEGQAPINAITLYVGNVPGPVFATSLLAVAVSMLWLWYSHRLDIPAIGGFFAGALAPALVLGWNAVFQLAGGPLWFAAGLVLADRTWLRHSAPVSALMGIGAGIAAVGLRGRGLGIEGAAFAVLGVQLVVAATEGAAFLLRRRRVVTVPLGNRVRSLRPPSRDGSSTSERPHPKVGAEVD